MAADRISGGGGYIERCFDAELALRPIELAQEAPDAEKRAACVGTDDPDNWRRLLQIEPVAFRALLSRRNLLAPARSAGLGCDCDHRLAGRPGCRHGKPDTAAPFQFFG